MNGTWAPTDRERAVHVLDEARQPLAAIMFDAEAALKWLRRDTPDIDEALRAMERIVVQSHRAAAVTRAAAAMVCRLPKVARITDVNAIILELLEAARPDLDRACITVEAGLSTALGTVVADRDQLRAVLSALVANAVTLMGAAEGRLRRLTIRSRRRRGGGVSIDVADTGIAISASGQILSPELSCIDGLEGIGMRVAECISMIEVHGGTLRRTPNQPRGNVFTVSIPN